ncbi:unnamed protein product [Rhizopus stolonifer]
MFIATFETWAIAATTAFADRAVFTITELANSSIGVNDNLDEDENVTIKPDKVDNTGDSVKVGNVAEKANDSAGEVDDTGDTVANYATDCIRSQLISKAKLFSDKEEIYKLLMSGCVNMMNAVQRSEYKHILNESQYNNIIQQCYQMKQFEPIPTEIDLIINEIFDALLPFRFE